MLERTRSFATAGIILSPCVDSTDKQAAAADSVCVTHDFYCPYQFNCTIDMNTIPVEFIMSIG